VIGLRFGGLVVKNHQRPSIQDRHQENHKIKNIIFYHEGTNTRIKKRGKEYINSFICVFVAWW
jgi:hypothetical protein